MNNKIHIKSSVRKLLLTLIVALISLNFLFPLITIITNSFMSENEITQNYSSISSDTELGGDKERLSKYVNLKLIPDQVVIKQYYQVLIKRIQYLFFFWNSIRIVIPVIIGQVIIASGAAYAFAKLQFRFREQLFFIYIITMLMPFQVTLVPNYIMADKLGLIGSIWAIICPGIFTTFGVFLLRQFMIYIPDEYSEAARVDGANELGIFAHVVLPMAKTGIASLVVLLFIDNWNMVEQPLIFLKEVKDYPLSVNLSKINEMETGIAFASSALYMAPMLLIFLYGENYLIEGLHLSGIKG